MKLYSGRILARPFLWISICFMLGIIAGSYFGLLFSLFLILILFASIFVMYYQNRQKNIFLLLLIFVLLGCGRVYIQESFYNSRFSVARFNDNTSHEIVGVIKEDLKSIEGDRVYLKPYFVDNQRVNFGLIQLDKRYLPLKVQEGMVVKGEVILKEPAKQRNPGGFSFYSYLKHQGVYSLGYLEGELSLAGKRFSFRNIFIKLKRRLTTIVDITLNKPYNNVLKALLLGERDNIPEEWDKAFTYSGVNHLLAISGLHVGFILFIFTSLFSFLPFSGVYKKVSITVILILYMLITGMRASITRAGLLAIFFLWAPVFKRNGDLFNLLGLTAFINLIFNPYALFKIGFQLSYLVVIMIVLWYKPLKNYLPSLLAVSVAAQIGSIPLTTYYFNLITPVGIITNIWAVPLVGVLVSLTLVGLLLGLLHPVFALVTNSVGKLLLGVLYHGVSLMTKIPGAFWEVLSPSPVFIVYIYILLIIIPFLITKPVVPVNINRWQKYIKYITVSIVVCLLVIISPLFKNELIITFLDVGQGDAILLEYQGSKNILVDGGGLAGTDRSKGQMVILPYLKKKGIKTIDLMFVTHFDTDHALGLVDILKKRKVKLIVIPKHFEDNYLSQQIFSLAADKNVPVVRAGKGDMFQFGMLSLEALNPGYTEFLDHNENSLVLKVLYKDFSLLLTGDLGWEGEKKLLSTSINVDSHIIKLGHHGSGGSTSYPFLHAVNPQEAIISVGANNYGHPSPAIIQKLKKENIRIWRTDEQGAIILETTGNRYSIYSKINK